MDFLKRSLGGLGTLGQGGQDDNFVGRTVLISDRQYAVRKKLAEGLIGLPSWQIATHPKTRTHSVDFHALNQIIIFTS
jgi:hypothetical protein